MIANFFNIFFGILFNLIDFAILARIILTWFPGSAPKIKQFLFGVTEPILGPFRKVVPRIGMIDISPIVALLVLDLLHSLIASVAIYMGQL